MRITLLLLVPMVRLRGVAAGHGLSPLHTRHARGHGGSSGCRGHSCPPLMARGRSGSMEGEGSRSPTSGDENASEDEFVPNEPDNELYNYPTTDELSRPERDRLQQATEFQGTNPLFHPPNPQGMPPLPVPRPRTRPGTKDRVPDAPNSDQDTGYPKAPWLLVSYCSGPHRKLVHTAALRAQEAIGIAKRRLDEMAAWITSNPIPPIQTIPNETASTYQTFSSYINPRLRERTEEDLVEPTALVYLNIVRKMVSNMHNATIQARGNTRFTEIVCGTSWMSDVDDEDVPRPGYAWDNRTTTQNAGLERDQRWVHVPVSGTRPGDNPEWSTAWGYPLQWHYENNLVGLLEHEAGPYPVALVVNDWEEWWGWELDGFVPRRQGKPDPDKGPPENPPYWDVSNHRNYSWPQLRRDIQNYPAGKWDMLQLVVRRLMPALISAFRMSALWCNYPGSRVWNTNIPEPGHHPWTPFFVDDFQWEMLRTGPIGYGAARNFGDLILDLYKMHRSDWDRIGWPQFTYLIIALYVNGSDWSTGMNRPLQDAYTYEPLDWMLTDDWTNERVRDDYVYGPTRHPHRFWPTSTSARTSGPTSTSAPQPTNFGSNL